MSQQRKAARRAAEARAAMIRRFRRWALSIVVALSIFAIVLAFWQPWKVRAEHLKLRWDAGGDLSAAMRSVEAELRDLSPAQLSTNYKVDSADASWMVIHQVRAFGPTNERIAFLGDQFRVSPEGNLHVRQFAEGHPGKLVAILARRMKLTDKVPTRYGDLTVNELAHHSIDHYGTDPEDPIWLLDTLCSQFGKTDFHPRDEMMLVHYVTRCFAIVNRGKASLNASYCMSMHLYDTLSRFCARRSKLTDPQLREAFTKLDDSMQTIGSVLKAHGKAWQVQLPKAMIEFHQDPTRETAMSVNTGLIVLGHLLEVALDDEGVYRDLFTDAELDQLVDVLSRAISLWYSTEYRTARSAIEQFSLTGDVRIAPLIRTNFMHSYSGMRLYLARKAAEK